MKYYFNFVLEPSFELRHTIQFWLVKYFENILALTDRVNSQSNKFCQKYIIDISSKKLENLSGDFELFFGFAVHKLSNLCSLQRRGETHMNGFPKDNIHLFSSQ